MSSTEVTDEPFDLPPAKAAELIGITPDTLAGYAQSGRIISMRTPGGHRRYRRSDVLALLTPDQPEAAS